MSSDQEPIKGRPSSVSALSNTNINNNSFSTSSIITQEASGIPLERNTASMMRNIPASTSFKEQKRSYNLRKRYFTKNIHSAIESTQEVHSGWLKARTAFKRWIKVWCQVKPGYLIMYTSQEAQKKYRLGVLLLSVCQVIKRPTKKEGFCFKLINPFNCTVWAKSSTKALAFSQASLTLRASDPSVGKLWLDAFHRCSLSTNLDGYQPVIDEALEASESMQSNRSNMSDSEDDGEIDTRQSEGIRQLNHSNSSSNNTSLLSFNSNCQSGGNGIDKPHLNGNALLDPASMNSKTLKSSQNNLTQYRLDENDNKFFRDKAKLASASTTNRNSSSSQFDRIGKDNFRTIATNNKTNSDLRNRSSTPNHEITSCESGTGLSPNSSKIVAKFNKYSWEELQLENVKYIGDSSEELGMAGVQSEDVHDNNKNFLWHIIKQLRPGMDLSKVTLPTFILEPRSFLEKLADYYYHCDILSEAVLIDDPLMRLINIVKWYLSGFYKKPKGPKKPYNPILGERFRCFWVHPKTQSRTFFVAEQVSHHPPISAFHVSNKKDGYTMTCALLSRSKFGGNSVSAILDGRAKLYLSRRGETYTLTMPHANCRGILLGSLYLELCGKVEIECIETGCKAELDFKLAPVWAPSNSSSYNALSGRILKDNKVTHTLDGHWDKKINIVDKRTDEKSVLWEVTDAVRNSRLKRYTVALEDQDDRESVKLWSKVTDALQSSDQTIATVEKTKLEDMQRQEARDRKGSFMPEHFSLSPDTKDWSYRWKDERCWNDRKDIMQFEENFKIRTLMLSASSNPSADSSIPDFNPIIDLPLTQMNKNLNQNEAANDGRQQLQTSNLQKDRRSSANHHPKSETKPAEPKADKLGPNVDTESMLQAIRQVTERSRKCEEEIATLKRGKKTAALITTVVIVALLGIFLRYFS